MVEHDHGWIIIASPAIELHIRYSIYDNIHSAVVGLSVCRFVSQSVNHLYGHPVQSPDVRGAASDRDTQALQPCSTAGLVGDIYTRALALVHPTVLEVLNHLLHAS